MDATKIPKHCFANCLHLKECCGGSLYCLVTYDAKQAIRAEEDEKIFETIRRKMNFEEANLIMNDMLNISKLNKNVMGWLRLFSGGIKC